MLQQSNFGHKNPFLKHLGLCGKAVFSMFSHKSESNFTKISNHVNDGNNVGASTITGYSTSETDDFSLKNIVSKIHEDTSRDFLIATSHFRMGLLS